MEAEEYNPEKKVLPIVGIVLMALGLIGFIAYIVSNWYLKIIPSDGMGWAFIIIVVVVVALGSGMVGYAKKKKCGNPKLLRAADVLSWGFIIVLVIGFVLKFFIH